MTCKCNIFFSQHLSGQCCFDIVRKRCILITVKRVTKQIKLMLGFVPKPYPCLGQMRINALILSCLVWQSFSIFFKIYFRSVGTFARALDCSSSVKQPSLHMSAAAASRDITLVSFEWLISFVVWYWSLNVLKPFVKM